MDGQGIPLGVTVTGANVHDSRLIGATLKNSREMGGWFLGAEVRHLCLDKGYDYPRVSEEVYVNGFEEHIRSRGEEVREGRRNPARRWVVERTFAWLKGFRSLRTRYCCYLVNFMGLLYLALACILLPRQFYGTALPCFGLYPLEKTCIARCMPDILLEKLASTAHSLQRYSFFFLSKTNVPSFLNVITTLHLASMNRS